MTWLRGSLRGTEQARSVPSDGLCGSAAAAAFGSAGLGPAPPPAPAVGVTDRVNALPVTKDLALMSTRAVAVGSTAVRVLSAEMTASSPFEEMVAVSGTSVSATAAVA